jgi:hypothetical protein
MVYSSNGGFNWSDIYFMPIKLRDFYWNELIQSKEAESDALKSASKGGSSTARRR